MDAMPKISIIIPAYNVEQYIQECLESCINQTYSNIEIIIIDDSSTDRAFDICKQYQQQDSRIMLRQNNQNKGVSYSRNKGLDAAKGEYILFVDADDFISEDLCAKAIACVGGGGKLLIGAILTILRVGKKSNAGFLYMIIQRQFGIMSKYRVNI